MVGDCEVHLNCSLENRRKIFMYWNGVAYVAVTLRRAVVGESELDGDVALDRSPG